MEKKIRIIFLASEPQGWCSLHSLYLACMADPLFNVTVINIGWGSWLGISGDCAGIFERNKIEYLDGIKKPYPIETLTPDLIVTECPYDQLRPQTYNSAELERFAKLLYIPYGVDFGDRTGTIAKLVFGLETQKRSWRIISRVPETCDQYRRYGDIPSSRIAPLGLPILDLYNIDPLFEGLPETVKAASAGKFKILYTPHHTLDGWSTFLRYGQHMRRLLQERDDWYLLFRPHPGLGPRLNEAGIMSHESFRNFFPSDRSYLYDSYGYLDVFLWSDLLISDASSFLVEYAPSHKPVIYLHRDDGWGIDDTIRRNVFEGYYIALSEEELTFHLDRLQRGIDPLNNARYLCQSQMSVGMFAADAGSRIARFLRQELA
jgi:CDP-Glycerol:Poly(glycerophosphate) glycerophosphotransferase